MNSNVTEPLAIPEPPLRSHVTVVPSLMMMLLGQFTVVFG